MLWLKRIQMPTIREQKVSTTVFPLRLLNLKLDLLVKDFV